MASESQCCYLGKGKVYIKPYFCPTAAVPVDPNNFLYVGNSEKFSFTPNVNEIEVKDFTSCAGGTECSFQEIESVDVSLVTTCSANIANLKRALLGESTDVASAAVVDEPHVYQGSGADSILILNNVYQETANDLVVTNLDTAAALVLGTDYNYENGIVTILAAAGLASGVNIGISYTTQKATEVEGLLSASQEFVIKYVGENCTSETEKYLATFYRVRLTAQEEFDFINEDFLRITFSGKALKDSLQVGAGKSKYFKVIQAS